MTTPSRRNFFPLAALAILVGLLPACYTLFKHPRVASLNYSRPDEGCINCHARDELWQYLHTRGTLAGTSDWDAYQNEPWWNPSRADSTPPAPPGHSAEDGDS